jgi:5'-methylthioadenosine/S-adenosylhomocysteine nucleosidase
MILILGALDCEIKTFKQKLKNRNVNSWKGRELYLGSLEGRDVILVKSGVGKVLAAMVTQRIIDSYPVDAVIFSGLAGALNPGYGIGDIIIGADTIQYDMDVTAMNFELGEIPFTGIRILKSDPALMEAALSVTATPWGKTFLEKHAVHVGRILTGDRFVVHTADSESRRILRAHLAGDAVEMEGAAVGLVAFSNGIPFLLTRTVSDRADGNARKDFSKIMKSASDNSYHLVTHILSHTRDKA